MTINLSRILKNLPFVDDIYLVQEEPKRINDHGNRGKVESNIIKLKGSFQPEKGLTNVNSESGIILKQFYKVYIPNYNNVAVGRSGKYQASPDKIMYKNQVYTIVGSADWTIHGHTILTCELDDRQGESPAINKGLNLPKQRDKKSWDLLGRKYKEND